MISNNRAIIDDINHLFKNVVIESQFLTVIQLSGIFTLITPFWFCIQVNTLKLNDRNSIFLMQLSDEMRIIWVFVKSLREYVQVGLLSGMSLAHKFKN